MKKALLILFCLTFLVISSASGIIIVQSFAPSGADYPDILFWLNLETGDNTDPYTMHASNEYSAGDTTGTFEQAIAVTAGSAKVGSYGMDLPTAADNMAFAISAEDIVKAAEGRIGFYLYIIDFTANGRLVRVYGNTSYEFRIRMKGTDELQSWYKDSVNNNNFSSTSANLSTLTWYFVEYAWKTSTNYREFFINGTSAGSAATTIDTLANLSILYIGNDAADVTDYYIDQFMISNDSTRDLNALKDTTAYPG